MCHRSPCLTSMPDLTNALNPNNHASNPCEKPSQNSEGYYNSQEGPIYGTSGTSGRCSQNMYDYDGQVSKNLQLYSFFF